MSCEKHLIRQCLAGSQAAFAELVDAHKAMVYSLALRVVGDREVADDLAQETFVCVYRGLASFEGKAKLSTWIYQIAYRVCLAELKKPHRQQHYVSADEHADGPAAGTVQELVSADDRAFENVDLRLSLDRWLGELPPAYRAALTLFYLRDRRYGEIAEIMQLPLGTVKTYLHRAKQSLRNRIMESECVA